MVDGRSFNRTTKSNKTSLKKVLLILESAARKSAYLLDLCTFLWYNNSIIYGGANVMSSSVNSEVVDEKLNTNLLINSLLKQLEAKDRQMEQLNQTIANLTETINE